MRSAAASGSVPDQLDDRTAKTRIRDAAIGCFADNGVAGTSIRAIAAAAGVSPGLVIHHFGTKAGLRRACDLYVIGMLRQLDEAALASGPTADALAALRALGAQLPVTRYLARTLVEGSPQVAALVDEMVDNAVALTEHARATGAINPSSDEFARAAVITVWSLGALVLHEHVRRLLGEDVTGDLSRARRYLGTTMEILGSPVFAPTAYEQWRAAVAGEPAAARPEAATRVAAPERTQVRTEYLQEEGTTT